MPDRVKEKLVELILSTNLSMCIGKRMKAECIADNLIANGVTVQGEKHCTDLTGKCGSCAWAKPAGEGYTASRVRCEIKENVARLTGCKTSEIKWRTEKACKQYKPLPELPKED